MTLSKVIWHTRGFLQHKKALRPQKQPGLAKIVQNYPRNVTFRSGRGPDRYFIGTSKIFPQCNIPLCHGTRHMFLRQSITLFSINDPQYVIRAQARGDYYITKWFSGHKSRLDWQKNPQKHPQNVMFSSVRGRDSCYIGNQPIYF